MAVTEQPFGWLVGQYDADDRVWQLSRITGMRR